MIKFYKVKIKLEKRGMTSSEKVSMEKNLFNHCYNLLTDTIAVPLRFLSKFSGIFEALQAIGNSEMEVNFLKKFQCF